MKCFDDQLLQKYIDNECTETETAETQQHLSVCPSCRQRLVDREELSAEIKKALHAITVQDIQIPVFRNRNPRSVNRKIKFLLYSLSAACILLFALFIVDKGIEPHQKEITIVQSVPVEVDANRPASDQEFVIEVYDGNGKRSEYYVE